MSNELALLAGAAKALAEVSNAVLGPPAGRR